ncbi:MAG TPA: hypothetical protein VLF60_05560 [Candidatus Saccharimonadales bacterium]|nr:hypothetical protein [Candidatus Saccharimonadales bacterium]
MKQSHQNLIVINGRTYDARSGLIVKNAAPTTQKVFSDVARVATQQKLPTASLIQRRSDGKVVTGAPVSTSHLATRQHVAAKAVHRAPQKTHTLLRSGLRRPQVDITPHKAAAHPRVGERNAAQIAREVRSQSIAKPQSVSRFSATPAPVQPPAAPKEPAAKPSIALAQLQHQRLQATQARQAEQHQSALTGTELKEHLIQERIAEAPATREDKFQAHQSRLNSFFAKQPRLLTAVAGAVGVLLLIGYVTYLNLPGISMRVAANRAGFAATMPGYKPSGYSLSGPVAYSPGQISLKFASNTSANKYNLTQKQSGWDSQALLDNYVSKQTDNYLTYQEKGLTIYMYDGKAAWVNGGVWYSIDGNANLSSDQILNIATSM